MLDPDSRVIMISGANRGIGKAIAAELTQRGYRLSLGARDPGSIENAGEALVHAWDATSKDDSAKWVKATLEHYGRIDGVVLNAGVMYRVGFSDGTEAQLDTMWDVNFKGPWRLIRAAMEQLKAGGQGRVVNIVSLGGKRLLAPENLGYSASKFASMALTHAIRQDGWESGVRATAICPGLVDTDMVTNVKTPPGQYKISPESIAATAAFALSLPNEATVAEMLVNSRLEPAQ